MLCDRGGTATKLELYDLPNAVPTPLHSPLQLSYVRLRESRAPRREGSAAPLQLCPTGPSPKGPVTATRPRGP